MSKIASAALAPPRGSGLSRFSLRFAASPPLSRKALGPSMGLWGIFYRPPKRPQLRRRRAGSARRRELPLRAAVLASGSGILTFDRQVSTTQGENSGGHLEMPAPAALDSPQAVQFDAATPSVWPRRAPPHAFRRAGGVPLSTGRKGNCGRRSATCVATRRVLWSAARRPYDDANAFSSGPDIPFREEHDDALPRRTRRHHRRSERA